MYWTWRALSPLVRVSRAAETVLTPFHCSASFYCITSCWCFLFISINSDFHFGPTFSSFSTIFAGRINSHLLKLSKFNVSHLTPWMLLHVGNPGKQYQFSYSRKFLLYHINVILKLDILVCNFGFFSDPFRFLVCINGMISWLWNKTMAVLMPYIMKQVFMDHILGVFPCLYPFRL